MSQQFCPDNSHDTPMTATRLASGYDELTQVDQALGEAERRLAAAHRRCGQWSGPSHAQELYRELLALRDRSRRMLSELAEIWVADR